MFKKLFALFLFVSALASFACAYSLNFSAEYQTVGGIGNDIDFNPDTHEDKTYLSQRLIPAFEFALNDNISIAGKYQVSKIWGDEGPQGSSFASDNNNFRVLDSYIKFSRSDNEYMKAGWQYVTLPSFTFGNPFFNGHTPAVNFKGALCEDSSVNFIVTYPFRTQDNMPKTNSGTMTAVVAEINEAKYHINPYVAYTRMEHDVNSPYNWAAADNNAVSYITTGGIAAQYSADEKTTISADAI